MKFKVFAFTAAICSASFSYADEPNVDIEAKGNVDTAIASIALAKQLADVGMNEKDPLLLMAAAKVYKLIPTQDKVKTKTTEEGVESTKEKSVAFSGDTILEAATEFSGDNKTYLSMISDVQSMKSRGRHNGPGRHVDRIRADARDYYTVTFDGKKWAEVLIVGDGDTDLDLYVYDEYGNRVCKDTDDTDQMYCSWMPRHTGKFKIKIRNLGDVYNDYVFFTN